MPIDILFEEPSPSAPQARRRSAQRDASRIRSLEARVSYLEKELASERAYRLEGGRRCR